MYYNVFFSLYGDKENSSFQGEFDDPWQRVIQGYVCKVKWFQKYIAVRRGWRLKVWEPIIRNDNR